MMIKREYQGMELLAPAGDRESLTAAVQNGADAVYMGGQALNARRGAGNFDADGMLSAVEYCHERGVRVYVTVNTMVKQTEFSQLEAIARQIFRAGADAAIVGEIGVAHALKAWMPTLELHASTQLAVHNRTGVCAAGKMGFRRVVLAREMTDEEVKECSGAGVDLEVFAHGALCVSCSGQCLFSSLVGGRSGNRGMCAQPCRLPYALSGGAVNAPGHFSYILSPRDLCQIDRLEALRSAGVSSIKLEGRLKRPEYVAVVTRAYRHALDALYAGVPFDVEDTRRELLQIFNRGGFTRGYGPGLVDAQLIYPEQPNHMGVRVGRVSGRGVILERAVAPEDSLVIRSKGAEDRPVRLSGEAGQTVPRRDSFPEGAELVRLHDDAQLRRARASYEGEHIKVPVQGSAWLQTGESARMHVTDGTAHVEVLGRKVEPAVTRALDEGRASEQLRKTGGTPYHFAALSVHISPDAFLPASALNELRRLALDALRTERITTRRGVPFYDEFHTPHPEPFCGKRRGILDRKKPLLCVQASDIGQLLSAAENGADELCYAPPDVTAEGLNGIGDKLSTLPPVTLALPMTLSGRDLKTVHAWTWDMGNRIRGAIASNIAHLSLAWPGGVRADFSMNIANANTVQALQNFEISCYAPSVELTLSEVRALEDACGMDQELIVYGRLPLFQLRHCPLNARIGGKTPHRNCRRCDDAPGDLRLNKHVLIDRKRVAFPLQRLRTETGCIVRVLNSVPLMLLRKWERLPRASRVRVLLTDESRAMAGTVIKLHRAAVDGCDPRTMAEWTLLDAVPSTTGHYFRGVE